MREEDLEKDFKPTKRIISWVIYIVDIHDVSNPFILKIGFKVKIDAINFLRKNAVGDRYNYLMITGKELAPYNLPFKWCRLLTNKDHQKKTTYDYGNIPTTPRERKTIRARERSKRNRAIMAKKHKKWILPDSYKGNSVNFRKRFRRDGVLKP